MNPQQVWIPKKKNRFNTILSEISDEVIVLLSTHLVEDVRNLCSNLAVMNKGSLQFFGSPKLCVETLEDKLWSKEISKTELPFYREKFSIISEQLIERQLHITVYSETPLKDFVPTPPSLEHFYFNAIKNF